MTITAHNDEDLRSRAMSSLTKKKEFRAHVWAYTLVNGMLIAIWALTGAGFFWPMFPLLGWGIGLFFHGLDTYGRGPTEAQIRREMDRLR